MRKPRTSSELYQVDFLAALFGGFLLLWLSRDAGLATDPSPTTIVIRGTIDLEAVGRLPVVITASGSPHCAEPVVQQSIGLRPKLFGQSPCASGGAPLFESESLSIEWPLTTATRATVSRLATSVIARWRKSPEADQGDELPLGHQFISLTADPDFAREQRVRGIGFDVAEPVSLAIGATTAPARVRLPIARAPADDEGGPDAERLPGSMVLPLPCALTPSSGSATATSLCGIEDANWDALPPGATISLQFTSRIWGRRCAKGAASEFASGAGVAVQKECY